MRPIRLSLLLSMPCLAAALLFAAPAAADQSGSQQNPFDRMRENAPKPEPKPPVPAFHVPAEVETAPIRLVKARARLRAGQEVGYFPKGFLNGCIWTSTRIDWPGGRGLPAMGELEQAFADEFEAMGYAAVSTAFGFVEREPRVDYDVAAIVTDLSLELCHFVGVFETEPRGRYKGNGRATVEWEIRDRLTRRVVLRLRTEGHGKVENPTSEIVVALMERTFADAAARLAAKPETFELLRLDRAYEPMAEEPRGPVVFVQGPDASRRSAGEGMAHAQNATVTIVMGQSHGSGFFISEDGYLLTNFHVVGNQESVRVRMNNGLELVGEVVKRHERRDVALVKLPVNRVEALPILTDLPPIGSDVFAVGAPLEERLHSTVSRGVVSAIRPPSRNAATLIQSDVTIHGGNSGGPLLDANGNVRGLSVSAIVDRERLSVGLNFFIPIAEALEVLNVQLSAGS